jgi:hypothetical protein
MNFVRVGSHFINLDHVAFAHASDTGAVTVTFALTGEGGGPVTLNFNNLESPAMLEALQTRCESTDAAEARAHAAFSWSATPAELS